MGIRSLRCCLYPARTPNRQI
ncbi:hypothetical protein CY0110_19407 [Crocosphaera chwakensis CCY0110]|uniref:Uncharacterized protein n=1 Tax=Crocosphaera chwakensis CCY0110 TaxID=391612 RepID=A3IJL3_9CHRO|nr:hypothetical protein CY0110_19407 [Crocosphaera chwakensis CCY0110]